MTRLRRRSKVRWSKIKKTACISRDRSDRRPHTRSFSYICQSPPSFSFLRLQLTCFFIEACWFKKWDIQMMSKVLCNWQRSHDFHCFSASFPRKKVSFSFAIFCLSLRRMFIFTKISSLSAFNSALSVITQNEKVLKFSKKNNKFIFYPVVGIWNSIFHLRVLWKTFQQQFCRKASAVIQLKSFFTG